MIKKNWLILTVFQLVTILSVAQDSDTSFINSVNQFRASLNQQYKDKAHSPLTKKQRRKFKGHQFYTIDSKYSVTAKFIRTPDETDFEMKTTTDRKPIYRKYAEAHFEIDGKQLVLSIYQNQAHLDSEKYKNNLFLLFTDKTSGHGSYYGGRYIDLKIPEGDTIEIDFNKSYNPYCHYNSRYSCPIPPSENHLDIEINAGIKSYGKAKH